LLGSAEETVEVPFGKGLWCERQGWHSLDALRRELANALGRFGLGEEAAQRCETPVDGGRRAALDRSEMCPVVTDIGRRHDRSGKRLTGRV